MLIYIITFFTSCMLIKNGDKKNNLAILFLGLFLPCILAGLRSEAVGTDVVGYVKPLCELAQKANSVTEYIQSKWWDSYYYREVKNIEFMYNVLVIICIKIFNSKQLLLLITQVLIIFPLWAGLKKILPKGYAWYGMLVYYLMFYNVGLNAMRQWIAMAIMVYGFSYLILNRTFRYFICITIAFLFHKSAIIGIAFWILYKFLRNKKNWINVRFKEILFRKEGIQVFAIVLLIIIVFAFPIIIILALKLLGLSNYISYFEVSPTVLWTQIIIRAPLLVILWLGRKNMQDITYRMLLLIAVGEILFANYVAEASHLLRVSYWFSSYNIITYPYVIQKVKIKNKNLICIGILVYLLLYWFFFFVLKCANETIPYKFFWQ